MMQKNIFIIAITLLFYNVHLKAQNADAMNYQGVISDAAGNPLVNTTIGVQFEIINQLGFGSVEILCTETHQVTTNDIGAFTALIGIGTGNCTPATINWSIKQKDLRVSVDTAGGTNYVVIGQTYFRTVPYAYYALKVEEKQNLTIVSDSLDLSGSGDRIPLTAFGDNLGDHIASQDIILGTNKLKREATSSTSLTISNDELIFSGSSNNNKMLISSPVFSGLILSSTNSFWETSGTDTEFKISNGTDEAFPFSIAMGAPDSSLTIGNDGTVVMDQGITIGGSKVSKLDQGVYNYDTDGVAGVNTTTLPFGTAFTSIPKVNITVKSGVTSEMYVANVISTTTTDLTISVYRIDNGGGAWTTDLDIEWMAWE